VLTAVSLLGDRGTLKSITAMVHKWTGREMVGHVYLTLGGLAERGIITLHSDPSWEYGEHAQHRFQISEDGDRALRRAKTEVSVWTTLHRREVSEFYTWVQVLKNPNPFPCPHRSCT